MSESMREVVAGAGVVAVAAGFLVYASGMIGLDGASNGGYPLTASFRSANGVNIGSDVRLAGVKIGTVTDLNLNETTFRADATFSVKDDILIPDDSAISISSEGLLGGNFVEIIPGGSPINLDPGEEIVDTQSSVSLVSLLMKFVAGNGE
ncbi:MAG: outer membrane lipid asymmetry maintenance protein MlaD [Litoreibacter sp.]|nr:outer membrane lipid asymmetry maintenance protein MlaD [Litoreibacter sp.]